MLMGVGVAAGAGGGSPHATSASETIAVSVANDSNLLTTMPPSTNREVLQQFDTKPYAIWVHETH